MWYIAIRIILYHFHIVEHTWVGSINLSLCYLAIRFVPLVSTLIDFQNSCHDYWKSTVHHSYCGSEYCALCFSERKLWSSQLSVLKDLIKHISVAMVIVINDVVAS